MAAQKGDRAETVEMVEVLDGLRVIEVQTRAGDPWVGLFAGEQADGDEGVAAEQHTALGHMRDDVVGVCPVLVT